MSAPVEKDRLGLGELDLRTGIRWREIVDLSTGGFAVGRDIVVGPDSPDRKDGDRVGKVGLTQDLEGSLATDPEHPGDLGVGHDPWRRTHGCTIKRYLIDKVPTR